MNFFAFKQLFKKRIAPSQNEGELNYRAQERERRIALTAWTSLFYKFISSAIPLLTVKITYDYLGVEVYGLWNAVTNFFALFAFSDLGLGNGLQTKLSQAYGKDDVILCRKLISSTMVILMGIAAIFLVVFGILYPLLDWGQLMNAKSSEAIELAAPVVFIIVIPRILSIPVAIITRTQYALQEGYDSNIWGCVGSIFSLVFVVVAARYDLGKEVLLAGSAFIPLIVSFCNMSVYYGIQRKEYRFSLKYVDKQIIAPLFRLGLSFCFLSILTTVGLSMDTFIVGKTCSLEDAASFSIIYKVSLLVSALLSIFTQPLWGANGEALARGDYEWVKNNTRKNSLFLSGITMFFSLILIFGSRLLFRLWLGEDFVFSIGALTWMCLLQVSMAFISPYFMVLNAYGDVKHQLYLFLLYTPLSLILKVVLSHFFGQTAIPAVGTSLYFMIIVVGTYILSNRLLKKLQE